MARMRRAARVSRGTSPARKWVWARDTGIAQTIAANGEIFVDLLAPFEAEYGADLLGATVMRIRGSIKGDQSTTWAARIMTQSTFASLVSGVNGPRFDVHADWFWFQPYFTAVTQGETPQMEVDNKAARKLDELGQSLLLAVSNESSAIATVSYNLSVGVKLP